MGVVGDLLDIITHFGCHFLGQLVTEVVLQDVGDAALAGLAVDADDVGLVFPVDVLGVQGQVGNGPQVLLGLLTELHALGDGVLMGAGEGGEDQLTGVRLPIAHGHAGDLLIELHGAGHIGKVQLGVHAMGVEVHGQGDQVYVAGALAVAEQGAFHPLAAGQHAQFGGGDSGAAVVVGVEAEDDVLPVVQVFAHEFDLLGVHVRHGHLYGRGQVDDDLPAGPGLPDVDDGVADAQGELHFGAGEAFGGVFKPEVGFGHFFSVLVEELGTLDGDLYDLVLILAEDLLPLGEGGGVVQVDHHVFSAFDGGEGLFNNMGAGLGEDLDGHVIGDEVLFDQGTQEFVLSLGSGGEAHLDLLESDLQ